VGCRQAQAAGSIQSTAMQSLTALCLGAHRSCACSGAASHGRFPPGFRSRFVFPMAATRRGAGRHHHCHRVFCCVLRFFQLVKRPFIPGYPFDSLRGLAIRRRLCEQPFRRSDWRCAAACGALSCGAQARRKAAPDEAGLLHGAMRATTSARVCVCVCVCVCV
jgi:hypothetical protein